MIFLIFLKVLILVLCIILRIAFITLYERHILGLSQNRLGPNKIFLRGILQAGLDGIKLISKEQILPFFRSEIYFIFIPALSFIFIFFEWLVLPYFFFFINFQFSFLFLICLVGFSVYFTIISGLLRISKYSFLGAIRSSRQSVSFEIVFSLVLFIFMLFLNSLNFLNLINFSFILLFFIFLILILTELNRAPFDFSEGERELVSGFNTEYSSVSFIFLFLGEYGVLIFFCVFGACIFFNFFYFFIFFFLRLLIIIRRSFPRYRYDLLIEFF